MLPRDEPLCSPLRPHLPVGGGASLARELMDQASRRAGARGRGSPRSRGRRATTDGTDLQTR